MARCFCRIWFSFCLIYLCSPAWASQALKIQGNWQWTTTIQTVRTFSRGGDLNVTYKIFRGDGTLDGSVAPGPWWWDDIPGGGVVTGYGNVWAHPPARPIWNPD